MWMNGIDERIINRFNVKLAEALIYNSPTQRIRYYSYELPPFINHQVHKRKMYREYLTNKDVQYKRHISKYNKHSKANQRI